eukprot:14741330-Alexandrium_andersonii.AAC.1
MEIFGDKERNLPGDAQLAADTLMSFVELYPDGKERTAKRRGSLDLTRFVHAKVRRVGTVAQSAQNKWDQELFITQMRSLRNWSHERSLAEWRKLEADPTKFADMGGP